HRTSRPPKLCPRQTRGRIVKEARRGFEDQSQYLRIQASINSQFEKPNLLGLLTSPVPPHPPGTTGRLLLKTVSSFGLRVSRTAHPHPPRRVRVRNFGGRGSGTPKGVP